MAMLVAVSGRKEISPVVHGQDAADGARVIAKEDAIKGDEQADDSRSCLAKKPHSRLLALCVRVWLRQAFLARTI